MSLERKQLAPTQTRDEAWSTQGQKFWKYEEGKRYRLPGAFENFYQAHRSSWENGLDIGCGTGRFLIPMIQDGLSVVGVEPAEGMRQGAISNLKLAGLEGKVQVVNGDSTQLNFPDASVDLVFSKGAIHHNMWAGVQKSFGEVARVLKPGGVFIFQGRSINDPALPKSEMIPDVGQTGRDKEGWKKGVTQHYFTHEELERLAQENGFKIELGPEEVIKAQKARLWVVYKKVA